MGTWDLQLARHGIALMADRAESVATLAGAFGILAQELGLEGGACVSYRPRSRASEKTFASSPNT